MIEVLAEVLLRRVRPAMSVTLAEQKGGGPRPHSAAVAAGRRAGRAPPQAPRSELAPPDTTGAEPDDAFLSLWAELAWRCLDTATEETNA